MNTSATPKCFCGSRQKRELWYGRFYSRTVPRRAGSESDGASAPRHGTRARGERREMESESESERDEGVSQLSDI